MFPLRNFRNRVIAAFPQEPVPSVKTLLRPDARADGCDGQAAIACFTGRKWGDLEPEKLDQRSLSSLSHESFAHYVAAYLYHALFAYRERRAAILKERIQIPRA